MRKAPKSAKNATRVRRVDGIAKISRARIRPLKKAEDPRSQLYRYDSPIGPLTAKVVGDAVQSVEFADFAAPPLPVSHPLRTTLDSYFGGDGPISEVPLRIKMTPFQSFVLEAVHSIPYGELRSYSWIARAIGRPASARAVGQALKRNPVPLIIPCHRVVASSGIGGYGGGLANKEFLIELEKRSSSLKRAV
jgi:methylated-DNA-[protein]-cysteine S-methyltransferase